MYQSEQNKRKTGKHYEEIACKYLTGCGLRILETNFRIRLGEIDIIASDQDCICFVEVKYRSTLKYGRPAEAVTLKKQLTIRKVAEVWLMRHGGLNRNMRFDVMELSGNQINYIKFAF